MGLEQKSQKNSLWSSNSDGWMAAAVRIETQTVVMPVGTTLAHDSRVIAELPAGITRGDMLAHDQKLSPDATLSRFLQENIGTSNAPIHPTRSFVCCQLSMPRECNDVCLLNHKQISLGFLQYMSIKYN
jgi:hypothetical protein